MTLTAKAPTTGPAPRTDDNLLAAVRAQEPHAFQELRDRHRSTALAVALLHTPNGHDAEQLAGTAFDQVLVDHGSDDEAGTFLRARLVGVIGRAGARAPYAAEAVTDAYLGLPTAWQAVLWYLDVEGLELSQAAAPLGLGPADTSALHLEARAGLRAAYRRAKLNAPVTPACEDQAGKLGAFVGGGLPAGQVPPVQEHLDKCPRCTAEHLCLRDTDEGLRSWVLPVLAGVSPWGAQAAKVEDLVRIAGHVSAEPVAPAPARELPGRFLAAADLPRRGRQVLLGGGVLATVVVLAGVVVSGPAGTGGGTPRATTDLSAGAASDAAAQGVPSSPAGEPAQSSPDERDGVLVAAGPGGSRDAGGALSLPTAEPSSGPLTESAAAERRADVRRGSVVPMGRIDTGDGASLADPRADDAVSPGAPLRDRAATDSRTDGVAGDRDGGSGGEGRTASTAGSGNDRPSSTGGNDRSSSTGAERPAQRPGNPVPSPAASVPGVQLAAPAPASAAPSPAGAVAARPAPSPAASVPGVQLAAPAPAAPAPAAPPAPSPVVAAPQAGTAAPVPAAPAPVAPAFAPVAPVPAAEPLAPAQQVPQGPKHKLLPPLSKDVVPPGLRRLVGPAQEG